MERNECPSGNVFMAGDDSLMCDFLCLAVLETSLLKEGLESLSTSGLCITTKMSGKTLNSLTLVRTDTAKKLKTVPTLTKIP